LIDNVAKVALAGAGVYFVFLAWNVDVTGWLASAGIIGIAVGFAAKDSLANLFAGLFISADAPYKVGDFIVLDSGERGRVTRVGVRSTRLLTRDDIEVTIPNAVIANAKIVNESGGPWEKERVRVQVSVAYGSDLDQVRAALMAVAAGTEHVCPEPLPRVRFRAFGESGLDFELLCWIDEPVLRGRTVDALNTAVYKRFQADGIEIPYPKRDVYVHQVPPSGPAGGG
jgi:small-conductance mechanosensitive channel